MAARKQIIKGHRHRSLLETRLTAKSVRSDRGERACGSTDCAEIQDHHASRC
jgi:hypothetical protein